jgi:Tol biopolymer transport system component
MRSRLIGVSLLASIAACASVSRESASVPGLPADGQAAVMFAPGVVSTGDVFASTFTPDGRTVVFTKFSPPKPMALMSSDIVGGRWTPPMVLPFSGTYRDLDPAFTPDGRRLYFSSARPSGPTAADTTTGVDTWYVDRTSTGWSAPVRLPEPVNGDETDMYPSVTRSGVLYFDSFRSRPRRRLAYRAEPTAGGTLGAPVALDATINADSGASNLFVDPDERYVVFAAVRPEGMGGPDLYVSSRTSDGWTPPRNLGAQVNGPGVEFCPFVSRDGRYLYFTRITTLPDKRVERNVFVVRFDGMRERLLAR